MGRPQGAAAMGVGAAATGVLAYVFFALVVRTLGADRAAPVSVLWTYWSFSAAGLSFPIQHWVSRTIADHRGDEGAVRAALPRLAVWVGGLSLVTGVLGFVARDSLFGSPGLFYPMLVVALSVGASCLGLVRGVLIGRKDLLGVGLCLTAENGLRVVFVVVLIALGIDDPRWYAAVLPLGQLCMLFWPAALRPRGPARPEPWLRFVASVSGGQVVGQTVLVGGPVLLALLGGAPHQVTSLFTALALFRAPYTFAIGALSPLTAFFTTMVVDGRRAALWRSVLLILLGTVVAAAVAAVLGGAVGPWLLRLVFGDTVQLSSRVVLLVALGSALALGTLTLSMVAMAHNRPHAMLHAWLAALVVGAVGVVIGPGSPLTTVTVVFVLAQAVACVWMAAGAVRLGRFTRTS